MSLFFENVLLAFAALKSNKSRAILTMLGIIIGIASVITIMTIGNSMSNNMTEQMASRGADKITVGVSRVSDDDEFGGGMGFSAPQRTMSAADYLSNERIEALYNEFGERILGICLEESVGQGTFNLGSDYANVSVQGGNKATIDTADYDMLAGRSFSTQDYEEGRKVCLVSDYFCNNLYKGDTSAPVGQQITIKINNRFYTYTVIGVYEYEQSTAMFSSSEYDTVTPVHIPLKAALAQTHNAKGYRRITVRAADTQDASSLSEEIETFLNNKFYRNNNNFKVSCFTMQSIIDELNSELQTMSLAVAVIAGISLLVGGIGVMNIMLVSVTERTREIGTRKALGATNSSIKIQFVVESIVLCLTGGFIGIVLGLGLGMIAAKLMNYAGKASVMSMVVSVLFSVAIGVFFGYYPASKAAKMNPIDALRYE